MESLFESDDFVTIQPTGQNSRPILEENNEPLFVAEEEEEELDYFKETNKSVNHERNNDFDVMEMPGSNNNNVITDINSHNNNDDDDDDDDILGLDNVNIQARRKIVNLSGDQLLSNYGLPYVKNNFRQRVKLKSSNRMRNHKTNKKHVSFTTEYENCTKLLQFYQLWAHKVFPKANFKDFLKLCYTSKKMSSGPIKVYREKWIQEEIDKINEEFNKGSESMADIIRFEDEEKDRNQKVIEFDDKTDEEDSNNSTITTADIDKAKEKHKNLAKELREKNEELKEKQTKDKGTQDVTKNSTRNNTDEFDDEFGDDDDEIMRLDKKSNDNTLPPPQEDEFVMPTIEESDHEEEMAVLREMGL